MKQQKTIIPSGHEIDKERSTFELIVFKPIIKSIRDQIQGVEDILRLNKTTAEAFDKKWKDFEDHEKCIAFEKLLVNAYNEGKVADWNDGNHKYSPRFDMRDDTFSYHHYNDWYCNSYSSARLCFIGDDAYKNMIDATTKFLPQYKLSRLS